MKQFDPFGIAIFYTQVAIGFFWVTLMFLFDLPFLLFMPKLVLESHRIAKKKEKEILLILDKYLEKLYGWRIPDYKKSVKGIDPDDYEKPVGQWK